MFQPIASNTLLARLTAGFFVLQAFISNILFKLDLGLCQRPYKDLIDLLIRMVSISLKDHDDLLSRIATFSLLAHFIDQLILIELYQSGFFVKYLLGLVSSQTYFSKRGRLLHGEGNVESVHAFCHYSIDMTLGRNR